jgi:hypothetical protein
MGLEDLAILLHKIEMFHHLLTLNLNQPKVNNGRSEDRKRLVCKDYVYVLRMYVLFERLREGLDSYDAGVGSDLILPPPKQTSRPGC